MERPLVHEQSPAEYFKELVEAALTRQHLQAGDLTEYYLVNLLCQYVRPEPPPVSPMRNRWRCGSRTRSRAAAPSSGHVCAALPISHSSCPGTSPTASLAKPIDVDYYKSMGEYAYGSLSRREDDDFAEVFAELARKFVGFMDVLADISERTALSSEHRCFAAVREVAANRQSARRPTPHRAWHPAEHLDWQAVHSIAEGLRPDFVRTLTTARGPCRATGVAQLSRASSPDNPSARAACRLTAECVKVPTPPAGDKSELRKRRPGGSGV